MFAFTTDKARLLSFTMAGAPDIKSTIPIIGMARVTLTGTTAQITGFDLDVEMTSILAEIESEPYDFLVNFSALKSAVTSCKAGEITIEIKNNFLTLNSHGVAYPVWIEDISTGDFPRLPRPDVVKCFDFSAGDLLKALQAVAHSISKEETRYYLNGVFLNADEAGQAQFCATDGHRMCLYELSAECPKIGYEDKGIIIPTKTVKALIQALKRTPADEIVLIEAGEGEKTVFTSEQWEIASKNVDGTFPDFNRVIPKSNEIKVEIDALPIETALAPHIASFKGRREAWKNVTFDINGKLSISHMPENDPAKTIETFAPIIDHIGEDLRIGFNADYIVQALKAFGKKARLNVAFGNPATPALLRSPNMPELTQVIMPLRV